MKIILNKKYLNVKYVIKFLKINRHYNIIYNLFIINKHDINVNNVIIKHFNNLLLINI